MAKINGVEFVDNSDEIKEKLNAAILAWLHEAGGEIQGQAARNSRVDSGQLKGSWKYKADETKQEAYIGSPLENAIWEEYGTGEYAANGDGRKGGWLIPEEKLTAKAKTKMRRVEIKGKVFYFTRGKTPNRTLERAFNSKKNKIQKRLKQILSEVDG